MSDLWFYLKGKWQIGPFRRQELSRKFRHGELPYNTQIRQKGSKAWQPASQTEGFGWLLDSTHEIKVPKLSALEQTSKRNFNVFQRCWFEIRQSCRLVAQFFTCFLRS